jgi:hypothetical protein
MIKKLSIYKYKYYFKNIIVIDIIKILTDFH